MSGRLLERDAAVRPRDDGATRVRPEVVVEVAHHRRVQLEVQAVAVGRVVALAARVKEVAPADDKGKTAPVAVARSLCKSRRW